MLCLLKIILIKLALKNFYDVFQKFILYYLQGNSEKNGTEIFRDKKITLWGGERERDRKKSLFRSGNKSLLVSLQKRKKVLSIFLCRYEYFINRLSNLS